MDEFVIDVTNNLGANAKNIENGWNESTIALLTDWSEKFLPGTTTQSGPVIASTDADKFNSLVCIKRTYAILGTYEGGSPAGRCDYDARVVDWHSGAVLAAQQFQGEAPPTSTHTQASGAGTLVIGQPPDAALKTWLGQVITG